MNPVTRWLRFNAVGMLGIAVQLTILAALHHVASAHYLIDTAIAVELTLLHNFIWHQRYTWRDRCTESRALQLLRFHLACGAISLAGNLLLMRLFITTFHLPLLFANVLGITGCSLANFFASHHWAFAANREKGASSLAPFSGIA